MTVFRRLWYVLTRRRRVQDLDEEMQLHIELRAAANRRRGLPPDEAARAARRRFGNPLRLREESRDLWGFTSLDDLGADVRYAARQLVRQPLWTLVVVLTLALGVGANTAVLTFVDAMLFRPASWNGGNELIWVATVQGRSSRVGAMSYADYLLFRERVTTVSGLLAYSGQGVSVGGAHPQRALAGLVSANFFEVLELPAALGRTFRAEEDTSPGAHPVVVLSDALWREQFGADPAVIGRRVPINGLPFTIVGVAPAGFTGVTYATNPEQLWVPLAMQAVVMPHDPNLLAAAATRWLRVAGRLRDGVDRAQAEAEVQVIARQMTPAGAPPERQRNAQVLPVRGGLSAWEQRSFGPVVGLIAIVPALVVLVACANVANVLLSRNLTRRRELAMRGAMGASRGRLLRLLLVEAVLLALLSGVAGFMMSIALTGLILGVGGMPADVAALLRPDARAAVATAVVSLLTVLLFGLLPAFSATRFEILPSLKDQDARWTRFAGRRLGSSLVVAQVAVSLALLIAAGLFLQSLSKALRVDPGFDPAGAVTLSFDTDLQRYTTARRGAFLAELVQRASAMPAVTGASLTSSVPLGSQIDSVEAHTGSAPPREVTFASVSPRYFETMRVPVTRGRDFADTDGAGALPVAIVNETLAREWWADRDPIGEQFQLGGNRQPWRAVVGVVRDIKQASLTDRDRGGVFVPVAQRTTGPLSLVVRTAGDPATALAALTGIVRDMDRDLPVFDVQTLETGVRRANNIRRAAASMFGVFGGLTLLLAAIGVYGVAAHGVSRRIREVGVRMSLGARAADVYRMVAGESLRLAAIGVAIGLAISAAVSTLLTSFLFGLTAVDAGTFVAASVVLALTATVAIAVPARRAARIDPIVALRHD